MKAMTRDWYLRQTVQARGILIFIRHRLIPMNSNGQMYTPSPTSTTQ